MALKQSATRNKQKKQKYFSLLDHKKGQKEDKSKFVTTSVGIIVTIIFI